MAQEELLLRLLLPHSNVSPDFLRCPGDPRAHVIERRMVHPGNVRSTQSFYLQLQRLHAQPGHACVPPLAVRQQIGSIYPAQQFIDPVRRERLQKPGRAVFIGIAHIQGDRGEDPLTGIDRLAAIIQVVPNDGGGVGIELGRFPVIGSRRFAQRYGPFLV